MKDNTMKDNTMKDNTMKDNTMKDKLNKILFYHAGFIMNVNGGECANLQGADLRGADLHGANLQNANLQGADLRGADLHGANLQNANLQYADLQNANLQYADLHGANLQNADLRGADLDYSCFPLWCGSLTIGKVDARFVYQILAHAAASCNSCDDPEFINVQNYLLKFVKKSHINAYCKHIKKRKHER